jgi:Flagellar hook-length control protein FliK
VSSSRVAAPGGMTDLHASGAAVRAPRVLDARGFSAALGTAGNGIEIMETSRDGSSNAPLRHQGVAAEHAVPVSMTGAADQSAADDTITVQSPASTKPTLDNFNSLSRGAMPAVYSGAVPVSRLPQSRAEPGGTSAPPTPSRAVGSLREPQRGASRATHGVAAAGSGAAPAVYPAGQPPGLSAAISTVPNADPDVLPGSAARSLHQVKPRPEPARAILSQPKLPNPRGPSATQPSSPTGGAHPSSRRRSSNETGVPESALGMLAAGLTGVVTEGRTATPSPPDPSNRRAAIGSAAGPDRRTAPADFRARSEGARDAAAEPVAHLDPRQHRGIAQAAADEPVPGQSPAGPKPLLGDFNGLSRGAMPPVYSGAVSASLLPRSRMEPGGTSAPPAPSRTEGSLRHPQRGASGVNQVAATASDAAPAAIPARQPPGRRAAISTVPNAIPDDLPGPVARGADRPPQYQVQSRPNPARATLPLAKRPDPGGPSASLPSAPTVDAHPSFRRRPINQTAAAEPALGVFAAGFTGGVPENRTISPSPPDHGDDRRAAIGSPAGADRRTAPADFRAQPDSTRDAAAGSAANADPSRHQESAQDDPAANATTRSPPISFIASASNSTISGRSGIAPDAPEHSPATATGPVLGGSLADTTFHVASTSGGDADPHPPIRITAATPSSLTTNTATASLPVGGSATASPANRPTTDLPAQLFRPVIGLIENPDHEVVLRLHPPELGDLTVRVLVNGREVSAWFATPQIQAQQAISQAIGQLHTDLGSAGYNLTGAWVGADAPSPRERNGGSRLPQLVRRAVNGAGLDGSPADRMLSSSAGVSVYV